MGLPRLWPPVQVSIHQTRWIRLLAPLESVKASRLPQGRSASPNSHSTKCGPVRKTDHRRRVLLHQYDPLPDMTAGIVARIMLMSPKSE